MEVCKTSNTQVPNDIAPNPPPITRKPSKTQLINILQTAFNLHQEMQFVS